MPSETIVLSPSSLPDGHAVCQRLKQPLQRMERQTSAHESAESQEMGDQRPDGVCDMSVGDAHTRLKAEPSFRLADIKTRTARAESNAMKASRGVGGVL